MALVNFKKGLLASLPSTYAEGTFYVTTDERAIYLDVAADKRIRLGDFQEFATVAALEANANPSTSALYYITEGNILAKWDGEKYVQINVQKTLAELGGVSKTEFDGVVYDQGEGEAKVKGLISKVADLESTVGGIVSVGGQANVIETVKVNGTALTVTDKAVDVIIPTGALASKDKVAKADLASELSTEIDNKVVKVEGKSLVLDTEITKLAGISAGANKVEASSNGSIKIDGVDTVVYTHPDKHVIDDVTGLQDALNAKVNVADYNTEKASFALKSEVSAVDAKFANYNTTIAQKAIDDAQDARIKAIEDDYLVEADIANFETKENVKKVSDDLAGYKTSNDAALAGVKAIAESKTTTEEVKTQIEAYGYATEADLTLAENRITDAEADIVELQKIKVTETSVTDGNNTFTKYDDTALEARVKSLEENPYVLPDNVVFENDLTVYRTSADQDVIDNEIKGRIDVVEGILNDKTEGEVITKGLVSRVEELEAIDHDQLAKDASAAAVATVLDGAPEKFNTLKEIASWIAEADTAEDAASLVTRVATIEGDYLKKADKTELEGKINNINDHSHTFVESELNEIKAGDVAKWNAEIGAKELAASKTTAAEVKAQIEAYAYATEADLTLAEGRIKAIEDDYLKSADKTALQAEIDADVKVVNDALEAYKTANNAAVALKANSADVYAKTETFTREEVNAAIATALTWGEF